MNILKRWLRTLRSLGYWFLFVRDFFTFRRLDQSRRFSFRWSDRKACLHDNTTKTGFDRHYVYHPAWAARVLAQTKPEKHVDISSILSFSAVLSAFLPVEFYDYRPADLALSQLTSQSADLLALPFASDSVKSLSCMHTVEHVGLGRYGDALDPEGDRKAIRELIRVLAPGGDLLFVVPVGAARIQFNAHRIYTYQQIKESFSELVLQEFALIPDKAVDGGLIRHASPELADRQKYACGCFWFKKPL